MVKSALASFLKEILDKVADYTKYVHLAVYTSTWALLFLILLLIGAPPFVPLLVGGVVNLLIGGVFWGLPSLLVKKGSQKGKNWKPLLSIINVGLVRYLVLPCWSLFFFLLIVSSFFDFIGKDEEKPSLLSKNSELVQTKRFSNKTSIFEKEDAQRRFKDVEMEAQKGDPKAQVALGLMYKKGEGVEKNYEEKVRWYRLAADQGYASAQRNLAISYSKGEGVPQDYGEALKWYKLAALQGDAAAQYGLGNFYSSEKEGIPQSFEEAVKWLKLAAEQGYVNAQYNLARLYYWYSEKTPEDYKEAFKWYTLAAEQGDSDAQFLLGTLYLRGHGTEFDFKKGMMFCKLAFDQGDTDAELVIKEYEKSCSASEIRKIQRMVKEWKRNHAN